MRVCNVKKLSINKASAALLLAAWSILFASCQDDVVYVNRVEYVFVPSISVAAMPDKTSYFVGEKLDLTGLRVSCVQKDGSVVDVPESDYTTEPAPGTTLEKAGSAKVIVSFLGLECAFSVTVLQPLPPCLEITTDGGAEITSKEEWMKGASLSLWGAVEKGWNFSSVPASIRGRGNSTWAQPKKPYAIKLDKKQEIMGMPAHKRWVLIANYLDNSFMRNCMAFSLSRSLGMDYTVRGEFVMLVLNGTRKGLYWLGEAIKADKNRVNIDEDNDYLIELDVYYDEAWKFKSEKKNLPYMIKNDDSMSDERLETLREKIASLESLLYPENGDAPDESYTAMLDVDSWAKFYLVNELMSNGELGHPKSCYFTFSTADNILKAGPVWDFDWASLSQADCALMNTLYYDALFKSPAFTKRLKEIWAECRGKINIKEEIEYLRTTIYEAQQYDAAIWGAHLDPSGIPRDGFDAYVDFLEETLGKKYTAVDRMIQRL